MATLFLSQALSQVEERDALARKAAREGRQLTVVMSSTLGGTYVMSGPVRMESRTGRDEIPVLYTSYNGSMGIGEGEDLNDPTDRVLDVHLGKATTKTAATIQRGIVDAIARQPMRLPDVTPAAGTPEEAVGPDGNGGVTCYALLTGRNGGTPVVFIPEDHHKMDGASVYVGTTYGDGGATISVFPAEQLSRDAGLIVGFNPATAHVDRWEVAAQEHDDTGIWADAGGCGPAEWA